MKRLLLLLPLVVFLGVAVFLYRGLFLDPSELPSALIGKPLPAFSLPAVQDGKPLTEADLKGKPALVNVLGHLVCGLPRGTPGIEQTGQAGCDHLRGSTTRTTTPPRRSGWWSSMTPIS